MSKKDRKAKKLAFVRKILGERAFSSHTAHYTRRRWNYIGIGASPLVLTIAFILFLLLWSFLEVDFTSAESIFEFINKGIGYVDVSKRWVVGFALFAIGFGTCGLLIVLAGRYTNLGEKNLATKGDAWSWAIVIGIAVLMGIVGVVFILKFDGPIDFLANILLLGPIMITILILGPVLDHMNNKGAKGRAIFVWLFGFFASVYILTLVTNVTDTVGNKVGSFFVEIDDATWLGLQNDFAFLKDKEQDQIGHSVTRILKDILIVINLLLLTSWLLWRQPEEVEETDKKSKKKKGNKQPEKKGFFGWIKQAVFGGGPDTEEETEITPQTWLDPLLESDPLPDGCASITLLTDEQRGTNKIQYSPESTDSKYESFFGEVKPTGDQHNILHLFLRGRKRDFLSVVDADSTARTTGDILIRGAPGSGKTTWLAATSIAAVVFRGDNVLVLCPTEDEADRVTKSIQNLLAETRVNQLLMISRLNKPILVAIEAGKISAIPEVMVATPTEIEHAFFKEQTRAEQTKKDTLRMLDAILVTDIMDFSSQDRLMLPFLIGKIRLINQVARKQIQTAVIVPHVFDKSMRKMIGDRLFSPIVNWEDVMLRAWRRPPEYELVIETNKYITALKSITEFILLKGQSVVILQPSLSGSQLDQVKSAITPSDISTENLKVVSSLSALKSTGEEGEEEPEIDWCIILNNALDPKAPKSLAVPSLSHVKKVAIIHFGHPELHSDDHHVELPVFASSKSQGILVQELSKTVPYLDEGSPISRNIWRQFGIPEVGRIEVKSAEEDVITGFSFRVDPPEIAAGTVIEMGSRSFPSITPWIQLQHYSGHHVEIGGVEDQSETHHLRLIPETELVVTKRTLEASKKGRISYWYIDGQSVDGVKLDLALTDVISLLANNGKRYLPESIVIDDKSKKTTIRGYEGSGGANEAERPMWKGSIFVPTTSCIIPATQGFPLGIRWYHIHETNNRIQPDFTTVEWTLNGYFSDVLVKTPIDDVAFEYPGISAIFALGLNDAVDVTTLNPHGDWVIDTKHGDRMYWPEMTAAIMAGLQNCAKDASRLGRLLAFRDKQFPNLALILVTEVPDYAGTLEEVFKLIFVCEELRNQFFAAAKATAKSSISVKNPTSIFNVLASDARQSMGAFDFTLEPTEAWNILNDVSGNFASEGDISLR